MSPLSEAIAAGDTGGALPPSAQASSRLKQISEQLRETRICYMADKTWNCCSSRVCPRLQSRGSWPCSTDDLRRRYSPRTLDWIAAEPVTGCTKTLAKFHIIVRLAAELSHTTTSVGFVPLKRGRVLKPAWCSAKIQVLGEGLGSYSARSRGPHHAQFILPDPLQTQ